MTAVAPPEADLSEGQPEPGRLRGPPLWPRGAGTCSAPGSIHTNPGNGKAPWVHGETATPIPAPRRSRRASTPAPAKPKASPAQGSTVVSPIPRQLGTGRARAGQGDKGGADHHCGPGADGIVEYHHSDRKLRACQAGHCHEARQEVLMGESLVSVAFDTGRKRRMAANRLRAQMIAHHDRHNGRPQMPTTQPEMEKVEGTILEAAKSHLLPLVPARGRQRHGRAERLTASL